MGACLGVQEFYKMFLMERDAIEKSRKKNWTVMELILFQFFGQQEVAWLRL